jgi:glycosyltransferase involved in cell wall biosynthesis
MRLLYITNNRFPNEKANGLQIAKMCEAFLEAKINFTILVPERKQTENVKTSDPQKFYKLREKVPIKRLRCLDLLNHHWIPGPTAWYLQTLTFFLNFRLQRRRLITKDTLIYTRSAGILAFLGKRTPWFFEAHTFPKTRFGQIYQKWTLKKAAGLVCISEGIAKKYKRLAPNIPTIIAHDAVDLKLFSKLPSKDTARKKLKLPPKKPIVLYTGSPYEWKGVFTLAKATAKLPNVTTIFLGGRAQESDFKKLSVAAPHALCLPFVPHDMVPVYLAAADLLILPNSARDPISREDTSPLKLFEYLASGRPILASRVPALQNVLTQKESFFFKPDNSKDLQTQIQKALNSSPTQIQAKTKAAYQKSQNHSWKKRTKQILNFMLKSTYE